MTRRRPCGTRGDDDVARHTTRWSRHTRRTRHTGSRKHKRQRLMSHWCPKKRQMERVGTEWALRCAVTAPQQCTPRAVDGARLSGPQQTAQKCHAIWGCGTQAPKTAAQPPRTRHMRPPLTRSPKWSPKARPTGCNEPAESARSVSFWRASRRFATPCRHGIWPPSSGR